MHPGRVGGALTQYLSQRIDNMDALPTRFRYLFNRLVALVTRLLEQLGAGILPSAFAPVAFELKIRGGWPGGTLELTTPTGSPSLGGGVVDRVDVMEKDGKKPRPGHRTKSGSKTLQPVGYLLRPQYADADLPLLHLPKWHRGNWRCPARRVLTCRPKCHRHRRPGRAMR